MRNRARGPNFRSSPRIPASRCRFKDGPEQPGSIGEVPEYWGLVQACPNSDFRRNWRRRPRPAVRPPRRSLIHRPAPGGHLSSASPSARILWAGPRRYLRRPAGEDAASSLRDSGRLPPNHVGTSAPVRLRLAGTPAGSSRTRLTMVALPFGPRGSSLVLGPIVAAYRDSQESEWRSKDPGVGGAPER